MDKNINRKKHTLKEYNKKYRNLNYKLIRFTKQEIEDFDNANPSSEKNSLLKGRNWWLIDDIYYQVPKTFSWVWFRNLNAGVQASVVIGLVAIIAAGSTLPFVLKENIPEDIKADINEAKSINTCISESGKTFDTCYDCVQFLKEKDIDITNKATKSDKCEYVFDKEGNGIAVINKEDLSYVYPKKTTSLNNIWRFVSTIDENALYSQYIKDDYNYEKTSLTVKSGLDVGNNDSFIKITYDNRDASENIIRTNGGALIVIAEKDTIKHYGIANNVLVEAVASNSYHEYGEVTSLSIASGHLVVEESAKDIKTINIVKPSDETISSENVSIDVKNDEVKTDNIVIEEGVKDKIEKIVVNEEVKTEEVKEKDVNVESIDDSEGAGSGQKKIQKIIDDKDSKISEIVLKSDLKINMPDPLEEGEEFSDFNRLAGITVSRGISIEGNGHTLTATEEKEIKYHAGLNRQRSLLKINAQNSTVTINNLNVNYNGDENNGEGYSESIRIENAFKSVITFNGVTNIKHDYYGMFIFNNNEKTDSIDDNKVTINFNNGNLIGYSAVKCTGNSINFNCDNSYITGVNDHNYGSTNACSAIQIGYPIYSYSGDILSCHNVFYITNSTLNAYFDPEKNSKETILNFLSPLHNSVEFKNCEFNTSIEAGHGENEYHYVSTCVEDIADLTDKYVKDHCSNLIDEKYKNITSLNQLTNNDKCPIIDYILVDGVKYGFASGYTKDDRFKVGRLDDDGDWQFKEYNTATID